MLPAAVKNKIEETRKELRDIMKFMPCKKANIHITDFDDEVVFREEQRKFAQIIKCIKENALAA